MNTTINKENTYSLHNIDNYKKEIEYSTPEITEKYYLLLSEYFVFIIENVKPKNKGFAKFIMSRGLETITNVFNSLFYYSKNLDLTYFHCQKSFYYYVEFVGQISEDEKMFLQLSSRDATTYVYKKTIFEINDEHRKTLRDTIAPEIHSTLDIIHNYVNIYKTFLYKIINSSDFSNYYIHIQVFQKICKKLNHTHLNKNNIEILNILFDKFYFTIHNVDSFFQSIHYFLKKYKLHSLHDYKTKINSEEYLDKLNKSPDKMIEWLIN
jgi:hypothetical protein